MQIVAQITKEKVAVHQCEVLWKQVIVRTPVAKCVSNLRCKGPDNLNDLPPK
jgi:hypothetical protein